MIAASIVYSDDRYKDSRLVSDSKLMDNLVHFIYTKIIHKKAHWTTCGGFIVATSEEQLEEAIEWRFLNNKKIKVKVFSN